MEQFLTIDQLPLDTPGTDGDNSLLKAGVLPPTPEELVKLQGFEVTRAVNDHINQNRDLQAAAKYVPFRREFKLGAVGNDVFAVRRALSKAGFGVWGQWGKTPNVEGIYLNKNLKAFQKKAGVLSDGIYGLSTHLRLMPYFDAYGAFLMKTYKVPVKKVSKRDGIVSAAMFGYHNAASIHYTESTWRMYGVRNHIKPPGIPRYEDCSSFATWCYWVAGAADPNGLGYNGQGYTGTLCRNGRVINLAQLQPGDLVFYYGSFSVPGHVAIYVGDGRVVSHGNELGPQLLPTQYARITEIRSYL